MLLFIVAWTVSVSSIIISLKLSTGLSALRSRHLRAHSLWRMMGMQCVSRLLEGQLLTLCDWNLYLHNDRPSPPSSHASYKPFLSLLQWPFPAFIISNWCFNSFCVKSIHHLLPHLSILAGRVFDIVLVCAYVCVHICTWVCVHVCMSVYACVCIQVHMGRAEHSLGPCSLGTIFIWFWNNFSLA